MSINLRRGGIFSSLVVAMSALFLLLGPSNIPGIAQAVPTSPVDCKVHYYALDSGKETTGAFGPAVTATDESGIKAELKERRTCGSDNQFDPALTAAHYLDWATATLPDGSAANLTSKKVTWADVNSFSALLATNTTVYSEVVAELEKLENTESAFSTEPVHAGQKSLYMSPDGNAGVTIKVGSVSSEGVNAVFTHKSGAIVRYRLECGFQPNWVNAPENVPVCAENECAPPYIPPTPTCEETNTCSTPSCEDTGTCYVPTCEEEGTCDTPTCEETGDCKDWDNSVDKPDDGVTVQPNDPFEPDPGPVSDPAPVQSGGDDPSGSDTPAEGADSPEHNDPAPDPGTGTTPGGDVGSVNPDPTPGSDEPPVNVGDPGNPF